MNEGIGKITLSLTPLITLGEMISLISIAIFIMGIYLMNKMFFGFQPGSKRINSDVGKFRTNAQKHKDELIPWHYDELELFSLNQKNLVSKRGFGRSFEGLVLSIYHEPMLYYYYKEYPATKKNAILFAQTSRYEIVYRIRAKSTQIFVNESFVGSLELDGRLTQNKGRDLLARIDRKNPYMREIYLTEKLMGSVILPSEAPKISPRAFEIDEKMDEQQLLLFIVLGVHEIVDHLTHQKRK